VTRDVAYLKKRTRQGQRSAARIWCIIRYSAALERKLDFNRPTRRAFPPGAERERERERGGEREREGGGRTHKWSASRSVNYSSFLQSRNFRLRCERRAERCEGAVSLCPPPPPPLIPPRYTTNYRHPRPHLLCRSVLRRGGKYLSWAPSDPALSLSLSLSLSPPPSRDSSFFRQARSADGRAKGAPRGIGPYRPLLARLRKAPTRLRERRFDKDRTERTGGKQPECICLEGADYSLPKEFYLAISGLRSALAEQQTSEDHFSSYLRCIGPSMTHEWRGTNRFAPTLSRLDRLCVYKLMIVRVYSCYIELTVSVTICDA